MRARYYAPDLKRFVNADIIAGEISNAITLNRYAYANANPVSFIDPLGLSADRESEQVIYNKVIYMVDKRDFTGFPIVGHTRLYFLGDNGKWYKTELMGDFPDKSTAQVIWEESVPDVIDVETGTFKEIDDVEYVVWNGYFNDSVTLAKQYAGVVEPNKDFGDYNFLFNNCSDYTDAILDVAKVEDVLAQNFIDGDSLISVPVVREAEASVLQEIDNALKKIGNFFEKAIEKIEEKVEKIWDKLTFNFHMSPRN